METKDLMTLALSGGALLVSFAALYFSQLHKPSSAMLILLERTFTPASVLLQFGDNIYDIPKERLISPEMRNLRYTLSNTGKQALYVKSIEILRGPDKRGHMRSSHSFTIIYTSEMESCLLDPGQILPINIDHPVDFKLPRDFDYVFNAYELVSVELISADGARYQICHDISELGASGPEFHHPLWDGVALGSPVRGSGLM
ncbi:hypothetical protein [Pseudomonas chlororaphis]|uniref:hypothetical protein n=1 Tax=Pseudomonas chlororaphis TaxID=587753 RepID=UPI000A7F347F|nr:hypothetical protein [Pseudomonas chlororaphis]AZD01346.1 hypothetical protein C4K27_2152 [Pseudomonas chlororaphis subsp. chlororaphis]MBM0285023.1 hypothetical protein [Pseudomonas chlororaphis]MDO1505696.1 hypothetical protein [Pseudomonas chlororaphis]TWR99113.1 hypothetical protein FJD36_03875 [Pseudomonas chlororaphis subsp. chlororaphis]WDG99717.1 hypothetical protein PUP54_09155 [Pseudomonas chlororaphis]